MSKFGQFIKGHDAVLVDFHADWCRPCKTMAPILKEVAGEMKDQLKVVKVDIDKNQRASLEYNIKSIPTLILFKNGKQAWRKTGVIPASELRKLLKQHL